MHKSQLVSAISGAVGLSLSQAGAAVDALGSAVGGALAEGDVVSLPGIGKLAIKHRKARIGRNPKTGEEIEITARNVVGFKAAKSLNDQINA